MESSQPLNVAARVMKAQPKGRPRRCQKADPLSGSRFWLLLFAICALTFATARFATENNLAATSWATWQYLVVDALVVAVVWVGRFSLPATAFAVVATIPALDRFIPVANVSIALSEVFALLFIMIFVVRGERIRLNAFTVVLPCIFVVSVLSLIGSPLGFDTTGILLRFGLVLAFIIILVSRPHNKDLSRPLIYGLLAVPLLAIVSYSGQDVLAVMFVANVLEQKRVLYSFQYPIWFALVVPFLLFLKAPRLLIAAAFFLVIYLAVTSFARSIVIGTLSAGVLYLASYRDNRTASRLMLKTVIVGVLGVTLVVTTITLGYLKFTGTQNLSNETRYFKMGTAVRAFREHPVLGAGFGQSAAQDIAERRNAIFDWTESISPEFGPLTVLSEVGAFGAVLVFYVVGLSFVYSVRCLRARGLPLHQKVIVLIVFGGFVSSFINSNAWISLVPFIFLSTPLLVYEHWRSVAVGPEHRAHVARAVSAYRSA